MKKAPPQGMVHIQSTFNNTIISITDTTGALVAWTGSRYPDLVIGSLIALLVLNGARRILRLGA